MHTPEGKSGVGGVAYDDQEEELEALATEYIFLCLSVLLIVNESDLGIRGAVAEPSESIDFCVAWRE